MYGSSYAVSRSRRALGDVGGTVSDVTGSLSDLQQWLAEAQSEITRINHAIQGGAAGAQAGYNAPTNMTPWLIGGAVVLGVFVFSRR